MPPAVEAPMTTLPPIERSEYGLEVPIPTLPLLNTLKSVDVAVPALEEPIANAVEGGCLRYESPTMTESVANGDVVPMPRFPPFVSFILFTLFTFQLKSAKPLFEVLAMSLSISPVGEPITTASGLSVLLALMPHPAPPPLVHPSFKKENVP